MINNAVHIVIDLEGTKYLLFFKQPIEKENMKTLVTEFKSANKEKLNEKFLYKEFLIFLHNKGYKDADIVLFGVTIDLHK